MIPYRCQEILQALHDNPKGLTAAQIFKIAKKKPGSELPDASTVSKLIYSMRNAKPGLVTSSDAAGGAIHKITEAGLAALREALGEEPAPPAPEPDLHPDDDCRDMQPANTLTGVALENGRIERIEFDLDDELEGPLFSVVSMIKAASEMPNVLLEDKAEKIALIESLETNPIYSGETRAKLAGIRLFLDQFEAA
ncbi:hypothetical protein [Methylomonas koyamae]|uniref:hypothetical protein n=1 Tax=Methylomonas koyamae TaxID=702114 RepID=UPI001129A20A|nr:hypothetical protein [Methylomonas koyamae]